MKLNDNEIVLFEETPKENIAETDAVGFSKESVLAKGSLSLYAQRILRVCASQIKDDDLPNQVYTFKISDFAEFFGLSTNKIHAKIRNALVELRQKVIILPIERGRVTGYISWGQIHEGEVDISLDPILKPLYQRNLTGKYPLKYIRGFAYSYTYRFYELFLYKLQHFGENNMVSFYISVEDLRQWLQIENSYKNYADIRKRIIVPIVADINGEKFSETSKVIENDFCNLQVKYTEIKEGRKIIGLQFNVAKKENGEIIDLLKLNTLQDESIYDELDDQCKVAYEAFRKLKVAVLTINQAYREYGADGFYKIYLNVKYAIEAGKVKNKMSYAAQCLRSGFMYEEEVAPQRKKENELKEIKKSLDIFKKPEWFDEKIKMLSETEKEQVMNDLPNQVNQFQKKFIENKTFDELVNNPLGETILREYFQKI